MSELQVLKKTIKELKINIDCLLIRMDSCEQFIERIFKMLNQSEGQQKYYSSRQIDKQVSYSQKKNQLSLPSIKQFLLVSPTKTKRIDDNSFSLMKNAILVNSHEIQELSQKINKLEEEKNQIENEQSRKMGKVEEAIELMAKVLKIMEKKIESQKDKAKGKSKSFSKQSYINYKSL